MCGPSGAGKGTLIDFLTSKFPDKFGFSVSYTTRQPRKGEVDGVQYNFVTVEKFKQMIANDEFIEHCEVHTNFYGTAKSQIAKIQAAQKIPLLDIDVQGAIKFYAAFPDSNFVAILPTSLNKLEARLRKRKTDSEASIQKRIADAPEELNTLTSRKEIFNYRVVNDDLDVSKRVIELLI